MGYNSSAFDCGFSGVYDLQKATSLKLVYGTEIERGEQLFSLPTFQAMALTKILSGFLFGYPHRSAFFIARNLIFKQWHFLHSALSFPQTERLS
jgi:hypothetical protein